ncbi:MAG: Uma2 family endonuclease [Deltaproteobacteria bacterium]|nr:Uma2 family endonuclease [Myxococcales bacterium]MDP3214100.1 Uma2 family endonuclease [Deltaproteobacteria bacterium]
MHSTARRIDPVHYPSEDNVGEHEVQRYIAELLRPLLARWLAEQGRVAHVGADQFFYWVEGDTGTRRAPDVYVIDGVAQDIPEVGSWKVWEGHAPSFALEVVSLDWKKDYDEAPPDYEKMGVRELVVFDPWATSRSRKRLRWQVFRRVRGRGFVRVTASNDDRVESRVLGAWLVAVTERGHTRVRLAEDETDEALVPTDGERAATAEASAAAAEAEVARLKTLLAELEGR